MTTKLDLYTHEKALADAKRARAAHSQECPIWDYEDNGGCNVCEDHDAAVRNARRRLERTREVLGL